MAFTPMVLTFLYGLPVALFGFVSRWMWRHYYDLRFTSVLVREECVATGCGVTCDRTCG